MTKIEWTDETWNPVVGCTKVSPGCKHCYAERMARRLKGMGLPQYQRVIDENGWTGQIQLAESQLGKPLHWRKPRRVFVCSMGDLFHKDVPEKYIWRVIEKCWKAEDHTFQILTKRPKRMCEVLTQSMWWVNDTPQNIWLGTSAENQLQFMERYHHLRQIPAAVQFMSLEPLLSEIVMGWDTPDWVIVGGESGPGARPMDPNWVRSLRDQCQSNGIPFFFKQWGAWLHRDVIMSQHPQWLQRPSKHPHLAFRQLGKKAAGRLLDGREWNEYPDLRRKNV